MQITMTAKQFSKLLSLIMVVSRVISADKLYIKATNGTEIDISKDGVVINIPEEEGECDPNLMTSKWIG